MDRTGNVAVTTIVITHALCGVVCVDLLKMQIVVVLGKG